MLDLAPLDPRKRIASLFLQPDCDMACRFCGSERGFSVMTFEDAEALLLGLREQSITNVVLGGGEPFLWPHDVLRLARRASELGFFVQICTNGIELPPDFAAAPGVGRYILPLEARSAELHDSLRLHSGSHHAVVLERIETLIQAGKAFTLSTVVTRVNAHESGALADLLVELRARGARIHSWHLYRFRPHGRAGRPNAQRLELPRADFLAACQDARARPLDFPVYRRADMWQAESVEFFWFENGRLCVGSSAAKSA
jgi:MoaA/NifB/PqqE/SkfB family radical SAM enzyme